MAVFRIEKTCDDTVMSNHHLWNRELILENIDYEFPCRGMLNELVEFVVDTVCSRKEMIRIAGNDYSEELPYCADCGVKMYVYHTNNGKRIAQYTYSNDGKTPVGVPCPTLFGRYGVC